MKDSIFVNIGENSFLPKDQIILVMDSNSHKAKQIKSYLKEKGPTFLIDLSGGKKGLSLLILQGGRGLISILPPGKIVSRCGAATTHQVVTEPPKKRGRGRPKKDEQTADTGSTA